MGFNKEKIRQIRWLMLFAALLVLALCYSSSLFYGISTCFSIIKPFLCGGVIAFVLNLPMRGLENGLFRKWTGRFSERLKRPVSLLLAIILVLLVIYLVIVTVVPQVTATTVELGAKIPAFVDQLLQDLEKLAASYPQLQTEIAKLEQLEINWESVIDTVISFLQKGAGNVLSSTVSVASGIIGGLVNTVVAFIFALYILLQKEKLGNQFTRLMTAYLPVKAAARLSYIISLANRNFSNFITGQCLEAIILGFMFLIFMTIFRMPYAVLVGVLIAFTALIPIVGAFIGCFVGAFLILLNDPVQALWFVVMFLILQQIEGNLIYPKVMGSSVSLPSIWILMAVSIGGSMFGITGMLFFIPLFSTAYTLLRESVNERNTGKNHAEIVRAVNPEGANPEGVNPVKNTKSTVKKSHGNKKPR